MRTKWTAALWAAAVSVLLTACGGGGGGGQAKDTSAGSGSAKQDVPGKSQGKQSDHLGNPTATCAPSGTSLSITANAIKFDKDCLAAPASQAFTISYDNKDSLPHNIAILESHTATEVLFRAEIVQGPKLQSLRVGALKPGTYAFHCEVHPAQMSGTFVVK